MTAIFVKKRIIIISVHNINVKVVQPVQIIQINVIRVTEAIMKKIMHVCLVAISI